MLPGERIALAEAMKRQRTQAEKLFIVDKYVTEKIDTLMTSLQTLPPEKDIALIAALQVMNTQLSIISDEKEKRRKMYELLVDYVYPKLGLSTDCFSTRALDGYVNSENDILMDYLQSRFLG